MLSVRDLCLERHFQPVFQPLSFELAAGELLVVSGPNGSGKTTLIRLLAHLITPTSGSVQGEAEGIHFIGHEAAVKDELSVRENLQFARDFAGGEGDVDSAIRRVGLEKAAAQIGKTLSAGQRKRTALARLLLAPAQLWLLDEPYANLDARGIILVDGLLDGHLNGGGACVMATHGEHRPVPMSGESTWRYSECALVAAAQAA